MLEKKMKLSHIIYKVSDLEKAFKEYEDKGFNIEYGKDKNPYNAVIYFAEGAYLEILQTSKIPKIARVIMSIFGKKIIADMFKYWDEQADGLVAVAIENDKGNLDQELGILQKHGLKYTQIESQRNDTKGRELKFLSAFPEEKKIPFFGAYRSDVNFRPDKGYVHPNGIVGIKSVSLGTEERFIPIIKELTDDPALKLFVGDGVKDLEFYYKK